MTAVQINPADVASVRYLLGDLADKYKSVMTTSINKTLTTAKTQAAARVGNKVNLKAARIKEDFFVKKANYSDISGSLRAFDAKTNRIGLIQYGARQTLKGVTVQIKKDVKRFLIPHAFIARRGTAEHVFWRRNRMPGTGKWPVGKKASAHWSSVGTEYRRPLSRRTGPSVAYWFSKPDIFEPVSIQAQHVYLLNVESKIDEIIRRHRD
jgi:hypothetical protein